MFFQPIKVSTPFGLLAMRYSKVTETLNWLPVGVYVRLTCKFSLSLFFWSRFFIAIWILLPALTHTPTVIQRARHFLPTSNDAQNTQWISAWKPSDIIGQSLWKIHGYEGLHDMTHTRRHRRSQPDKQFGHSSARSSSYLPAQQRNTQNLWLTNFCLAKNKTRNDD